MSKEYYKLGDLKNVPSSDTAIQIPPICIVCRNSSDCNLIFTFNLLRQPLEKPLQDICPRFCSN
ncbi:MAG TPA: hypothetical protein PK370_02490 [Candidatus Woesebacteria bacterium]|nr:hypothetical protein [Candidatus Woesebacteria bacterium]